MKPGRVVVVDYGVGNIGSILNMLRKIGAPAVGSASSEDLAAAGHIILPGVGSFDTAMAKLEETGLIPTLEAKVKGDGVPLLGICLGMQILTRGSEEGQRQGLGWIDADVVKFRLDDTVPRLKVPHMGWNLACPVSGNPLFMDLDSHARFYFVHSYHAVCSRDQVLCRTSYGYEFASGLMQDNIFGVQFHPEKSHRFGLTLLRNFVGL